MTEYENFVKNNDGKKIYLIARKEIQNIYESCGFSKVENPTKAQQQNLEKVQTEFPKNEFLLMGKKIQKEEKISKNPDLIVIARAIRARKLYFLVLLHY